MATSSFFCQNQMSDLMDGVLPKSRADELLTQIEKDRDLSRYYNDLRQSVALAGTLKPRAMHHEVALRIADASDVRSLAWSRRAISAFSFLVLAPALVFASLAAFFPHWFPWIERFQSGDAKGHFVRYFPMLQGAGEIVEEQANWLLVREPSKGSMWEEGGLSPEEFETSFQLGGGKASLGEESMESEDAEATE